MAKRTVQLRGGGSVTLESSVEMVALEFPDREFIGRLLSLMENFEQNAPAQAVPDWREQRDRTKAALADRLVEVPKPDASAWDAFPGMAGNPPLSRYHASGPPPPPPSELRQYFNGCHCFDCVANHGTAGTQYIDATMPGYDDHMAANQKTAQFPQAVTPLYFQGCKCERCKANRASGQLVWEGTAEHAQHIATANAAEIAMLERSTIGGTVQTEKHGEAQDREQDWF